SEELWPTLRESGFSTKLGPPFADQQPIGHAMLANAANLSRRTIDRICSGEQKTVLIVQAIEILMYLGYDERVRDLEERLGAWYESQAPENLEYLQALGAIVRPMRVQDDLTNAERQALEDIDWMYAEAQRESFIGITPSQREQEVRDQFRECHGRDPTPL